MNRRQAISTLALVLLTGCAGLKGWLGDPANVAKLTGWVRVATTAAIIARPELAPVFAGISALIGQSSRGEPVNLDALRAEIAGMTTDHQVQSIALGAIAIVQQLAPDEYRAGLDAVADGMGGTAIRGETVDFELAAVNPGYASAQAARLR